VQQGAMLEYLVACYHEYLTDRRADVRPILGDFLSQDPVKSAALMQATLILVDPSCCTASEPLQTEYLPSPSGLRDPFAHRLA
jgi:hypothetical protein